MQPIRLVIADDHEIFRRGFEVLLKNQQEISILAEAEDGYELIDQVNKYNPDMIITDIQMPRMTGIEATKILMKSHPEIGIIALTMFNDDHLIIEMLEAGAQGYLLKNTNKVELLNALHSVSMGGTYFSNATSRKMTKLIADSRIKHVPPASRLTEKETEIIKLICQEYSSKQIASRLGLSSRTVENYREKIQEKINAKNMVGIAVFAIKNGIYNP